jgi:hypothetical protein
VRRHDQVADQAADRRLAPVAEGLLRRPVELPQGAALVHDDDAVGRGVDHQHVRVVGHAAGSLGVRPDRRSRRGD